MNEVEAGTMEAEVSGAFSQSELPELLETIDVMYAMYSPQRGNVLQGASPSRCSTPHPAVFPALSTLTV